MEKHDSFGDRMKGYENCFRYYLPRRSFLCIRIDGRAFHTFCKGLNKPYDNTLIAAMQQTTRVLCEEIQDVKIAYCQSDEISLILYNNKRDSEPWFGNNLQKIVSLSASIATLAFNEAWFLFDEYKKKLFRAQFDSRIFVLPDLNEAINCLIWRQQDASRNSIEAYAHANFSQNSIHGLNSSQLQEKLFTEKNINWGNEAPLYKRGFCCRKEKQTLSKIIDDKEVFFTRNKWKIDTDIPIFSNYKEYIESCFQEDKDEA